MKERCEKEKREKKEIFLTNLSGQESLLLILTAFGNKSVNFN